LLLVQFFKGRSMIRQSGSMRHQMPQGNLAGKSGVKSLMG
jgi:hypothetical protein